VRSRRLVLCGGGAEPAPARRAAVKRRLGALCEAIYTGIYHMTPRERGVAIRALEGLTQTNCGWIIYRMRDVLIGFIDDASTLRERKARARARKGKQ